MYPHKMIYFRGILWHLLKHDGTDMTDGRTVALQDDLLTLTLQPISYPNTTRTQTLLPYGP